MSPSESMYRLYSDMLSQAKESIQAKAIIYLITGISKLCFICHYQESSLKESSVCLANTCMVYPQTPDWIAGKQLSGFRAISPFFRWYSNGQTRLYSKTKCDLEVGTWPRINGRSWRPLDPYDKVMEERHMDWVQPGRAWGPPCLTNTLCAGWTDGSRIQKKTESGRQVQWKLHCKRHRYDTNSEFNGEHSDSLQRVAC